MTKAKKGTESVEEFLAALSHPRKDEIELLRKIVLESEPELTEHIKWNAPSFCLNGDDRITMRIMPVKHLQLVFHRGVKAREEITENLIADPHRLLKWASNDRAIAYFSSISNIEAKAEGLKKTIQAWLKASF